MKTIIVASQNPVKCRSVLTGFKRIFPQEQWIIQLAEVESGVSRQPCSDKETRRGAINRAHNAQSAYPQADYWVGIEGGLEEIEGNLLGFAWIVILSKDLIGSSRSGSFFLPPKIAELVRNGKELGEADDIVFGRTNSKQANGAIGLLTRDVIDREALYRQAVILALIPFINPNYFNALK